jgi:hypothetical protein
MNDFGHTPGRLLIMSCSARKFNAAGQVPAWTLYDGVAFRVVKRLQREMRFPADVKIVIISALHGLISPDDSIELYDLKMTPARALELSQSCRRALSLITTEDNYVEVFASVGSNYLMAIEPVTDWLPQGARLITPPGGIGLKLRALKNWLTATD